LATPTNIFILADGSSGQIAGTYLAVERETAAWFDASTLEEEKAAARRLNKAGLDHALFAPTVDAVDESLSCSQAVRISKAVRRMADNPVDNA